MNLQTTQEKKALIASMEAEVASLQKQILDMKNQVQDEMFTYLKTKQGLQVKMLDAPLRSSELPAEMTDNVLYVSRSNRDNLQQFVDAFFNVPGSPQKNPLVYWVAYNGTIVFMDSVNEQAINMLLEGNLLKNCCCCNSGREMFGYSSLGMCAGNYGQYNRQQICYRCEYWGYTRGFDGSKIVYIR